MDSKRSLHEALLKYCNHIEILSNAYNTFMDYIEDEPNDAFEMLLNDAFDDENYYSSDDLIVDIKKSTDDDIKNLSSTIIRLLNQINIEKGTDHKYTNFEKLFSKNNHLVKEYFISKETDEIDTTKLPDTIVIHVPIISYNENLKKFIESISFDENGQSTFPEYFTFDNLYSGIINDIEKVLDSIKFISSQNETVTPNEEFDSLKSHFLYLNEIGIIDFLKSKYPDLISNDTKFAKVLSQIMRIFKENDIENLRTYIRDLRNNPSKFKSDKAMTDVKKMMVLNII